jgi:hypothetical protein
MRESVYVDGAQGRRHRGGACAWVAADLEVAVPDLAFVMQFADGVHDRNAVVLAENTVDDGAVEG